MYIVSTCIQRISAKATLTPKDQAQYISVKKLNRSANTELYFFSRVNANRIGIIPKTTKRIMPGIKKSLKGDRSKIVKGKPPNNFPKGEIINAPPPQMALTPRKESSRR